MRALGGLVLSFLSLFLLGWFVAWAGPPPVAAGAAAPPRQAAPPDTPTPTHTPTPIRTPTAPANGPDITPTEPGLMLEPLQTGFNNPIGIDHYAPSNKVVMSVNYSDGLPHNFELVSGTGTPTPFTTISGWQEEVKIATVRDTRGGFQIGEMFTGNGYPGQIARISPDGATVTNPWVTLSPEPGLLRGTLYVDRTGVFGGDLIVGTDHGGIWRVNSAGTASYVTRLDYNLQNVLVEGVVTVPNDPPQYGPWAGKIVATDESHDAVFAIDAQGVTTVHTLGIAKAEDIDLIADNENFFGVDYPGHTLWGAPGSEFVGWARDFLIPEEDSGKLWHVYWDASSQSFVKHLVAQVSGWEHITFSTAGIPPIPPLPTITPTFTPTPAPTPTFTCIPSDQWCVGSARNNPGENALRAVAAIAANNVWAGGWYEPTLGAQHTLLENWDGQQWTISSSPDIGAVNAIAGLPSGDVWVASDTGFIHWSPSANPPAWDPLDPNATGAKALYALNKNNHVYSAGANGVQRWNGSGWSSVTPIPASAVLYGLAAAAGGPVSANDHIWAVGSNGSQPYSLHFNGSSWTTPVPALPPNATSAVLNSVDILNELESGPVKSVWAVGNWFAASGAVHALTDYWDGSRWINVPNPIESSSSQSVLNHVWVNATGDVWAAGTYVINSQTQLDGNTLLLHWNGRQWDIGASANVGIAAALAGNAADNPALTDWAVGDFEDAHLLLHQALVEYITAPYPPAVTRSYYEKQVALTPTPGITWPTPYPTQGCAAALTPVGGQRLVILDFGAPLKIGNEYGIELIQSGVQATNEEIEAAVGSFAEGYISCDSDPHPHPITIIVGVNDSVITDPTYTTTPVALTSDGGAAWAKVVEHLKATYTAVPSVAFAGGIDAEPGSDFDPAFTPTANWAKGFLNNGKAFLYNFGSPDSYPYRPTPGPTTPTPVVPEPWYLHDGWNTDQHYQISYGLSPGRMFALPETYMKLNVGYWYTIARSGLELHNAKMLFAGQLTGCTQSCLELNRQQGWPALWLALNDDPATSQPGAQPTDQFRHSTDIGYSDNP